MDAMLFAAGLGTRLRPLTDEAPKALIEVGGVPMLERVARRAVAAGADRLVINTHYLGEQVERFVAERDGFGAEVRFSREPERRLETGGGLLEAAPHFRKDAPFLVHNTDVLTDFSLGDFYAAHRRTGALATLAVNERETSRPLLFDDDGLCGYTDRDTGEEHTTRETAGRIRRLGFCGVHVLSPEIFDLFTERGVFSIIGPYVRLAGAGYRIQPYRIGDALWMDIGTPERLEAANEAVAEGRV